MTAQTLGAVVLGACVVAGLAADDPGRAADPQRAATAWMESFKVDPADLVSVGENPYFVLKAGRVLTLEGKEDGKAVRLVITVLDETLTLGGVETRVVEERETQNGVLAEVSRNFFVIDKRTHDLYYFGEDVDMYEGGMIATHEGAWRHGAGGATFGLMLPGTPAVGARYYQEMAPKVAMDRAEVVSVSERITVPAGTFEKCVKIEETTPLEPKTKEYKVYAPGIGLVKDGNLALVSRTTGK